MLSSWKLGKLDLNQACSFPCFLLSLHLLACLGICVIHKSLVLKSVCDRDSGGDDGISARKFARYHLGEWVGHLFGTRVASWLACLF